MITRLHIGPRMSQAVVHGGLVYLANLRRDKPAVEGVIAATRGNHGQSIAFAARANGIVDELFYDTGEHSLRGFRMAMLHDPEVLILDEPTNGLDPLGIADIRGLIQRIAAEGKTIILASHLLDEVQKVCTDFCVLKKGMLIHSGNVEEELSGGQYFEVTATDFEKLQAALLAHPATLLSELKPEFVRLQSTASGEEINRYLIENGIIISGLAPKKMTLENQFINLVSNGA